MKKIFSALSLAAAGLISQVTNATPEPTPSWTTKESFASDYAAWAYTGDYSYKSCHQDQDGKMLTVENFATVLTHKKAWNEITDGKSEAEKAALRTRTVEATREFVNAVWRTNVAKMTVNDVLDTDSSLYTDIVMTFMRAQDSVKQKTGLYVMTGGIGRLPMIHSGCKLK